MIRGLDDKLDTCKEEVRARFDNLTRRMTSVDTVRSESRLALAALLRQSHRWLAVGGRRAFYDLPASILPESISESAMRTTKLGML
jgi:hypothetical protein